MSMAGQGPIPLMPDGEEARTLQQREMARLWMALNALRQGEASPPRAASAREPVAADIGLDWVAVGRRHPDLGTSRPT